MFKKLIAISSCFILLFISSSSNIVQAKSNDLGIDLSIEGYDVMILESTTNYQKVKFTNLKTNEVEYLEYELELDGAEIYTSSSKEGEVSIKKDGETIHLSDGIHGTNELIDLSVVQDRVENTSQTKLVVDKIFHSDEITPFAQAGKWSYSHTFKGSMAITVTTISAIAGILASIYGGPIVGVIVSAAGAYASISAKHIYWKKKFYIKPNKYFTSYHERMRTFYYKYHDYTGFVKKVERDYGPIMFN